MNEESKKELDSEQILRNLVLAEQKIRRIVASLKKLQKLKADPLNNLKSIKQEISRFNELVNSAYLPQDFLSGINLLQEALKKECDEWEVEVKKKFGLELEQALLKLGFTLTGNYPLLSTSFYTIEVNFSNNTAEIWYGPQQEHLQQVPLSVNVISEQVRIIHHRITKREFKEELFIKNLFTAYKIALYRQNKKEPEPIALNDILLELILLSQPTKFLAQPSRNNYYDYNRVFFSYDLFRLKNRQIEQKELNLVIAAREFTKRKQDFLWIPTDEQGNGSYYSHLYFRNQEYT